MKKKESGMESNSPPAVPVASFLPDDHEIDVLNVNDDQKIDPDPSQTSSLLAHQLSQLSMEDREEVLYDLHGVSRAVQETAAMISSSIGQLEIELENLSSQNRMTAYGVAKEMNPEYVTNRDFQLKFLRADRFDAKAAALRLARHFEVKLELFGKETLGRDIVQDDLDEESLEILHAGKIQKLPDRDRAGRAVFVGFPFYPKSEQSNVSMVG